MENRYDVPVGVLDYGPILTWPDQLYVVAAVHIILAIWYREKLNKRGAWAWVQTLLLGFFYAVPSGLLRKDSE